MRFSLRTLLLGFAIALVAFHTYGRYYCRSLEPSLFNYLLGDSIIVIQRDMSANNAISSRPNRPFETIYFALGRDSEENWIDPREDILRSTKLPSLRPASEADDADRVHYISNIRWKSWTTVVLDYGTVEGNPSVEIKNTFELERVGKDWRCKRRLNSWSNVRIPPEYFGRPDNNALHTEPFLGRASMLSVFVRAR